MKVVPMWGVSSFAGYWDRERRRPRSIESAIVRVTEGSMKSKRGRAQPEWGGDRTCYLLRTQSDKWWDSLTRTVRPGEVGGRSPRGVARHSGLDFLDHWSTISNR